MPSKSFARSPRNTRKGKSAPVSARPGVVSSVARWRAEVDAIRSALADTPALDRKALALERHPYNAIASSEPMRKAIFRIVERRDPDTPWLDAFRALERADRTGEDFAAFMDAYRDVVFMAGVEYATRSLPPWWDSFLSLNEEMRSGISVIIAATVREMAQKGGR